MTLEQRLLALRCGELTFSEFEASTRSLWISLAARFRARWGYPLGMSQDDVVQELILAAWQHVSRWDASRGVSIDRYVVWNAIDHAKRYLHRQRGVKWEKNPDCAPSRAPSLDPMGTPETRTSRSAIEASDGEASTSYHFVRVREALAATKPTDVMVVMALLEHKSIARAAEALYRDPDARRVLRLGGDEVAEKKVRQRVVKFANKLA